MAIPSNPFAGADFVPGENQSAVEGDVVQGFSTASTAFGSGQVPTGGTGSKTAFDLLNPTNARKAISGLLSGGASGASKSIPQIGFQSATEGIAGGAGSASEDDWRVRVSLGANSTVLYKDTAMMSNAIMHPLLETNGVVWPYTPSISVTHQANYSTAQLTHSNYSAHFYNSSDVADIQITGDFTVQNIEDGQYLMAAVYFFRAATKMFFGQGANVGNPPPLVFLDGYGSHYFPHVPCVITSFQHTLKDDVDYIQVPITRTKLEETQITPTATAPNSALDRATNGIPDAYVPNFNLVGVAGNEAAAAKLATNNAKANTTKFEYSSITTTTRVPTNSSITVTLRPVYSRASLHDRFDLTKFANGELLQAKDGSYGGFI